MAAYQNFMAAANASLPKVSCEELPAGVPHLVLRIIPENNAKFGKALKAIFRDSSKNVKFTFLPPRFVKKLTEDDISTYNQDITDKKPPLLVFFGKKGKTFHVLLLPFSRDLAKKALKGEVVEKPQDDEVSFHEDTTWLDSLGD